VTNSQADTHADHATQCVAMGRVYAMHEIAIQTTAR